MLKDYLKSLGLKRFPRNSILNFLQVFPFLKLFNYSRKGKKEKLNYQEVINRPTM